MDGSLLFGPTNYIDIICNEKLLLIKSVTNEGIYYYKEDYSLLLGPIKNDQITFLDDNDCYVYEIIAKSIINVFYINSYTCEELSCEKGIVVKNNRYFITGNKEVYIINYDQFICLLRDIDFDDVNYYYRNMIAYKNNKPAYLITYNHNFEIEKIHELIKVSIANYTNCFVCITNENYIFVIDKDTEQILIRTTGIDYEMKKVLFKYPEEPRIVYVFRQADGSILMFIKNGDRV